jgi:hypothetical protein
MFFKYKFNINTVRAILSWRLGIILFLLIACENFSYAALPVAQEYQVKAIFLYRFASFVRWPHSVFADRYTPFRICILGEDPFREELIVTVENERTKGRTIQIQHLPNLTTVDICQILFISQSEESYLTNILTTLQKHPILTVSDISIFVKQGGMIQFFKVGRKIRFYIAPNAAKQAGLKISGNLLRIAEIIR